MTEAPWIILTLRRTGGTSLTAFLSGISKFPSIEHEPFNVDRTLGQITRDFRENGDIPAMEKAVAEALEDRPNIKHCFEIIPIEITRALIEEAQRRGYHFMVLTRRNEARRLASLFLAISTGAWGSDHAQDIYPKIISGDLTPQAIDLSLIQKRVRIDYLSVGHTLSLLRNRGITYDWLVFEELYFGKTPIEKQAFDLATKLGIALDEDDPLFAEFSANEGQKSGSIAGYVENYDEAVKRLKTLCTQ